MHKQGRGKEAFATQTIIRWHLSEIKKMHKIKQTKEGNKNKIYKDESTLKCN